MESKQESEETPAEREDAGSEVGSHSEVMLSDTDLEEDTETYDDEPQGQDIYDEFPKDDTEDTTGTDITLAKLLEDSERSDEVQDSGSPKEGNADESDDIAIRTENQQQQQEEAFLRGYEKEEGAKSAFEDEYMTADNGPNFTTEDDSVLFESDTEPIQRSSASVTPITSPLGKPRSTVAPMEGPSVQYSPIHAQPRRRKQGRLSESLDPVERGEWKDMEEKAFSSLKNEDWLSKVRKSIALELTKSADFRRSVTEELSKKVLDLELAAQDALEETSNLSDDEQESEQHTHHNEDELHLTLPEVSSVTETAVPLLPESHRNELAPASAEGDAIPLSDQSNSSKSPVAVLGNSPSKKERFKLFRREAMHRGVQAAIFCRDNFAQLGMTLVVGSALRSLFRKSSKSSRSSQPKKKHVAKRITTHHNKKRGWPTGIWIVQEGDSLWSMSEKLMGDGERWPELYKACSRCLEIDPRSLRPGTDLSPCREELLARIPERKYSLQEQHVIITTNTQKGDTLKKIREEIVGKGDLWGAAPLPMDTQEANETLQPGRPLKVLLHHK
mmetsp:Transcript_3516/g.22092  ORF Transcript_3516/g.22092 Transcript_3516/m.22092 type:complete len:558 (-) Transcript_3516:648-2321(-)